MLRIPIRDHFRETRIFNARLTVVIGVGTFLVLVLVLRLFYLQIVAHGRYETLSQANRIRPIPLPAPRGLILDRNGVILAQNYPVYTVEITPAQVSDMQALLDELSKLVRVTDADLKRFSKQRRERPRFEAITLRTHLSAEEAARVAERLPYLNGAELQARLQRHYPLGGLAVHAIGYVGRISEEEAARIDNDAYRGMQHIGKLGLEATYEQELLGHVGFEKNETNAHGRVLRTLERIAPVAGRNLQLHLDAKLQHIAEQALGKRRGAVIATDPKTGAVLAVASTPTYDPNPFVNGIDPDAYQALLNDPDKPLINRALNGQYAPGSTIKVFHGLHALEHGEFDPTQTIVCPGHYNLPGDRHRFRDWKKSGHGPVTLHEAIVQSCDVYFYRFAHAVQIEAMKNFLAPFGFGAKSGVDLPAESEGILPSPAWKKSRGQPWYPGETVMVGIGQGPILMTPLQLVTGVGALGNGARRIAPRLAWRFVDAATGSAADLPAPPTVEIPLKDRAHLTTLIGHMTGVAHENRGTAYGIGHNAPYKIAGKTGTAQVKGIAQGAAYSEKATPERLRDHALFISFAPAEDPKIAVAVIVENGGHGSSAAAPIARKLMDYVILGKSDAPIVLVPRPEEDE